eukprot:TRINITY_DN20960_c0_g1_i1.p1 TRINITY_DN20960_c0_g1~~TRINITY_DN20960_c0_g1_i1.p1  ORF type:complete len:276 (+),score=43.27 TRINITY_DN20960_c0_g1_i1:149-976(+)
MEGLSMKLNRFGLEGSATGLNDLMQKGATNYRGSQVRADSGGGIRRDLRDLQRNQGSRREDLKMLRASELRNGVKDVLLGSREVAAAQAPSLHLAAAAAQHRMPPAFSQPVGAVSAQFSGAEAALRSHAPISAGFESQPRSLEEYVAQDLDSFWRWCPTPVDGLHRCGLLVKLFDYCGLTRKENKLTDKVKRLNSELHALGVFTTDRVEPHQRVPYEAFVQSRRLRDAVSSCPESQIAWEGKRMGKRIGIGEGKTPLALWVLRVIAPEALGLEHC